jgi:hypothetical protein
MIAECLQVLDRGNKLIDSNATVFSGSIFSEGQSIPMTIDISTEDDDSENDPIPKIDSFD